MDCGTIKNVGITAINSIVEEREKNGKYENFTSFCERIKDKGINKKCIEFELEFILNLDTCLNTFFTK